MLVYQRVYKHILTHQPVVYSIAVGKISPSCCSSPSFCHVFPWIFDSLSITVQKSHGISSHLCFGFHSWKSLRHRGCMLVDVERCWYPQGTIVFSRGFTDIWYNLGGWEYIYIYIIYIYNYIYIHNIYIYVHIIYIYILKPLLITNHYEPLLPIIKRQKNRSVSMIGPWGAIHGPSLALADPGTRMNFPTAWDFFGPFQHPKARFEASFGGSLRFLMSFLHLLSFAQSRKLRGSQKIHKFGNIPLLTTRLHNTDGKLRGYHIKMTYIQGMTQPSKQKSPHRRLEVHRPFVAVVVPPPQLEAQAALEESRDFPYAFFMWFKMV